AVAGRKDVLDRLDFAEMAARGQEKVAHPGTFNGNPVSAAAGAAALTEILEHDPTPIASARAAALREALNAVFAEERVGWTAYGSYSGLHIYLHANAAGFDPYAMGFERLKAPPGPLGNKLRLALLVHGVDISGSLSGFTSVTHGEQDIADTAEAFRGAIRMLRAEGELG
ncbi:MAG: aspartate aminotransferase family protein, partial [Acetobacteraceae bacterium]|nr:aspartate aminotransferase family protein [Acetobacteraceae bacterium]